MRGWPLSSCSWYKLPCLASHQSHQRKNNQRRRAAVERRVADTLSLGGRQRKPRKARSRTRMLKKASQPHPHLVSSCTNSLFRHYCTFQVSHSELFVRGFLFLSCSPRQGKVPGSRSSLHLLLERRSSPPVHETVSTPVKLLISSLAGPLSPTYTVYPWNHPS